MSEWQPIETAPKDRMILVWDEDVDHPEVVRWNDGVKAFLIGFPDGNADATDDIVGWTAYYPTHWQPLPSPSTT